MRNNRSEYAANAALAQTAKSRRAAPKPAPVEIDSLTRGVIRWVGMALLAAIVLGFILSGVGSLFAIRADWLDAPPSLEN